MVVLGGGAVFYGRGTPVDAEAGADAGRRAAHGRDLSRAKVDGCVPQIGVYREESHPPHKIVNLCLTFTIQKNKLTVLWGG